MPRVNDRFAQRMSTLRKGKVRMPSTRLASPSQEDGKQRMAKSRPRKCQATGHADRVFSGDNSDIRDEVDDHPLASAKRGKRIEVSC